MSLLLKLVSKLIDIGTPTSLELADDDPWQEIKETEDKGLYVIDRQAPSSKIIEQILKCVPIRDHTADVDLSVASAEIKNSVGDRIPSEVTNPVSLEHFLTKATGSFFLQKADGGLTWFADFSDYERYEVREVYERYGGFVYLNGEKKIHSITYLGENYLVNSEGYERVELIVKSTICLKLLVELHALRVHLATSEATVLKVRNKYTDIRESSTQFFKIATFNALGANRKIPVLIGDVGLVIRIIGLTPESYVDFCQNSINKGKFSREQILGTENTVWRESMKLYSLAVDKLIDHFFPTETKNNKIEIANFFISVTALHNQFGDVQLGSMVISGFFLPKIYKNAPGLISSQDKDLLKSLLVAVGIKCPKIGDKDIVDFFDRETDRIAWKEYVDAVSYHSNDNWFQPSNFETSVGF